jgi:hypothetical protein
MIDSKPSFWKPRLRASGLHFAISAGIAALAAALVFAVWYPGAYGEISGGHDLFLILISVDIILGPLLTLAIFNRAKSWPVLRRDLAVVGLVQLAALAYGMWTVFIARPVHMVFEIDRFRVVHAIEIPDSLLGHTPAGVKALPISGPTLLALRPFKNSEEKMQATMSALNGLSLSARPDLWETYPEARTEVLKAAKPAKELKQRFPDRTPELDKALASIGRPIDSVVYLPMVGRKSFWTVLLDSTTADVLATIPIDSF